ncbi:hypothetical protein PI124_g7178 [Phytophthora idaei]|nr:hypothetical protein PI125_g5082 [Phytophthora idaei]KAG3165235.1 hypothetical protein PI126_g4743 [Phytophthora idaei]KAG3248156.1 hypothetical protein PI124_g7178 [Phytophthora idaei]
MSPKTDSYTLFTPLRLSEGVELKNRIVHGPVTRARSDIDTHAPLERNAIYYEQRLVPDSSLLKHARSPNRRSAGTDPRRFTPTSKSGDGRRWSTVCT